MKTATVRKFRASLSEYIEADEAVMVLKHGKPAAFLIPYDEGEPLPIELKRESFAGVTADIKAHLDIMGATEEELLKDFNEWRKEHRKNRHR
jgi:antitoxin (DNA-binding transcriptional repressor) of toxin-antitoxin stability system